MENINEYQLKLEDFKIKGRIINKVRLANDMVILAKTQEELQ